MNTQKNGVVFNQRRSILKLIALGSAAAALPHALTGCGDGGADGFFPQSIASGDPRPDSVILWTHIEDPWAATEDVSIQLEFSAESNFETLLFSRELIAYHHFAHAVKVKVDKLQPSTYYYYRFKYKGVCSRVGRTKTAPLDSDTRNIKFAYISCQDYIGRYYNPVAHMLQHDDLDFVVHLGDYIYETNGEPISQIVTNKRQISFRDSEGAISIDHYEAARSLDNYRQLYQTYRSDPALQRLHEKFPMIAIWDDHEFSDDCYGPHANYSGGKIDEKDVERFRNSQRVYLEYMPIEVGLDRHGILSPESEVQIENDRDVVIYRDFHFGANMHLIMSDYRSYRADHMIREDAFPATVFADEEAIGGLLGKGYQDTHLYKEHMGACFEVEQYRNGAHLPALRKIATVMYEAEGLSIAEANQKAHSVIRGKMNAYYCNEMIKHYNSSMGRLFGEETLIYTDDTALEQMEKGLAFMHMGKIDLFSKTGIGSRYMVVKDVFDVYARLYHGNDTLDNIYGALQNDWIASTLNRSSANWRIYASSVSLAPMLLDVSDLEVLDPGLRTEYYLNLDQFDGFMEEKALLLDLLRQKPSIVISGDIHSMFVTDHDSVAEFTGPSVSSCTFSEALPKYLKSSAVAERVGNIDTILSDLDLNSYLKGKKHQSSVIENVDMYSNGYVLMECSSNKTKTTLYCIDAQKSLRNLYEDKHLDNFFTAHTYHIDREEMQLNMI